MSDTSQNPTGGNGAAAHRQPKPVDLTPGDSIRRIAGLLCNLADEIDSLWWKALTPLPLPPPKEESQDA